MQVNIIDCVHSYAAFKYVIAGGSNPWALGIHRPKTPSELFPGKFGGNFPLSATPEGKGEDDLNLCSCKRAG